MSCSTIKALWPGEKHEDFEVLKNGWGTAPVIWDLIAQRWLGIEPYTSMSHMDNVWPLWKDLRIPEHQRAVLMFTYDRAYVIKQDYKMFANDIRLFFKDFPPDDGKVNHWNRIAEIFESDPDCPAIGLYATSVSEDPFNGKWNEEKGYHDDLDWETAFDIYKELHELHKESK